MTPLKLPLQKTVMVSVPPDLTKNITSLKLLESPYQILENLFIRSPRDLIKSLISLKERI